MDSILAIFKTLIDRYQELPQAQKVGALALVAIIIASVLVMSLWVQAPDFQLLYANLAEKDAAAIVEDLKTQKIPYELGDNGHSVRVPADKVYELRLQLATRGLPEGGEVGLEMFEKTPLGMTEFVQKLNYQRALQGELARTVKSLEAIDTARVHLVIPDESLFLKEQPKGKASVTVKIKPGKTLTDNQIQGIVHLVASSVKNVPPENVAVVDLKGNILSGAMESSKEAMVAGSNYKYKRNLESEMEANIRKMLENALGDGKVIARVSADLNFDRVERTEEIFDPDSQVVRSEQRTSDSVTGAVAPGGVPGVQALLPQGETGGGGAGSAAKRSQEKNIFNYEINKVVRHVSKPTGELVKLSVSVLIDGSMNEKGEYQPRSKEEMSKYTDAVKSAIGFDANRGDQVKIENVQFDKSIEVEQKKKMAQAENMEMGLQIAKYALGAIFILLFFARVIRPMMAWMTTSVEVVPDEMPVITASNEEIEAEKRRLAELGPAMQEVRKKVGEFVESDPQFSASIVRKWLREKKVTE